MASTGTVTTYKTLIQWNTPHSEEKKFDSAETLLVRRGDTIEEERRDEYKERRTRFQRHWHALGRADESLSSEHLLPGR